ncbi:MAG: DUF86 domain-containing protein [Desulfomonile tiedjei]|nr:DUF86 domain-containing protein [Desulfomonile tiedjei]
MSRDREHLAEILDSAKLALSYASGISREQFLTDTQCQDAIIRRIEIIGEAARRISDEAKAGYPHLPWHEMTTMRNVMIHQYDDIDLSVVWDTVQEDLPMLIAALERLL